MAEDDIRRVADLAAASPYANPRPVTRATLHPSRPGGLGGRAALARLGAGDQEAVSGGLEVEDHVVVEARAASSPS